MAFWPEFTMRPSIAIRPSEPARRGQSEQRD